MNIVICSLHSFLSCFFSELVAYIRFCLCLYWILIWAITKFRQAICLPPTGIRGSVLPWICWAIWTSRNALVFEKKSYTSEETATKGIASAQEWNLAQQKNELHTSMLQKERETTSSSRRQQNGEAVICHTDAAWEKERKRAGLAWTFSGSSPPIVWEETRVEEFVGSPLVAEAMAVRAALSKAVELEIADLRIHTDCLTLLGAITGKSQRKEIIGIVSDIRSISSAFASILFLHIARSKNSNCDRLAKAALHHRVLNLG